MRGFLDMYFGFIFHLYNTNSSLLILDGRINEKHDQTYVQSNHATKDNGDEHVMSHANKLFKKTKRNIDNMPEQNEDIYTELPSRKMDDEMVKMVQNLGEFKFNDIDHASKLHYLIQVILPNTSHLSLEDILKPDITEFTEIIRLKEMLIISVTIYDITKNLQKVNQNIIRLQQQASESLVEGLEQNAQGIVILQSLKQTLNSEMKKQQEKFSSLLRFQLTQ
ncbi:hypothetical protein COBT_002390, partial [Conglomerata obtusa]